MDLPGANYRAIFKPKRKIKRKYILKKLFYFSKTFLPKKYLIPSKTYFLITPMMDADLFYLENVSNPSVKSKNYLKAISTKRKSCTCPCISTSPTSTLV